MLAQRRRELLGILCMRHVAPLLKGKTQDGSKKALASGSRAEISKLQSKGRIQHTTCFYVNYKLRLVLHFINGWGKNQNRNTVLDM